MIEQWLLKLAEWALFSLICLSALVWLLGVACLSGACWLYERIRRN